MKFALLHRAKINAGDFIIARRVKELLQIYSGMTSYKYYPGWGNIEKHLDEINKLDGLIICGGPALRPNFYPETYPLVKVLKGIKVPIHLIGVGLGNGFMSYDDYKFSDDSRRCLEYICDNGSIGVRDKTAQVVLAEHDIPAVFVGCPVMHYLDLLPTLRERIERIAFTPYEPHGRSFKNRDLELNREIIFDITKAFPKAKIYVYEHRNSLPQIIQIQGRDNVYIGGNDKDIEQYANLDLHIGHRLHAHLYFLSMDKPSFLYPTDARTEAMSATLGTTDMKFEDIDKFRDVYHRIAIFKNRMVDYLRRI